MLWKEEYNRKLTSYEEAAREIKSGDFITNAMGVGAISEVMINAILDRWQELQGVNILDCVQFYPSKLYDPKFMYQIQDHITYSPCFGVGTILAINKSQVPDHLITMAHDGDNMFSHLADVHLFMVSPPNEHGFVNLGPCPFYSANTIRDGRNKFHLRMAIAEVNDQMPIVFGDNWMHVSEIDRFIEISRPMPVVPRPAPTEVDQAIGNYALELIKDGDNLQMGIGGTAEALSKLLTGKHDLGVLTELLPTTLPDLVEKGIVTNRKKHFYNGISTGTFGFGDKRFYDFVNENPAVNVYPGITTNNPCFIASNPNVVALNSCIMVDFTGQSCCDSVGNTMISGIGGQLDFMIGSFLSDGGRGILMLPSSRLDEKGVLRSNIVPEMPGGTRIGVPATYAQYYVTEYGIANIRYLTRRKRAEALIAIAHPDLRSELRNELKARFYPKPISIPSSEASEE